MKNASLIYGVSVVIMVSVMIGITRRMIVLERNEQLQALKAENERLALWRIESQLLPLVLRESARSYGNDFFQTPSVQPLANEVALFFRGDEQRGLSSIAWRRGLDWCTASSANWDIPERPAVTRQVREDTRQQSFMAALGDKLLRNDPLRNDPAVTQQAMDLPSKTIQGPTFQSYSQQEVRSQNEYLNRSANSLANSAILDQLQQQMALPFEPSQPPATLRAFWVQDLLYLARWGSAADLRTFEGCVLDWQQLESQLLESVRDLLPQAQLLPLLPSETGDHHVLANLPLRLVPGDPVAGDLQVSSALMPTLLIAWVGLAVSALALGALLIGVVRLSERRAAFVSAVTHELRTPLTTFRLYADLLGNRAGLTEEKHHRYVDTLKSEAERLQYLIENVLDWSRLERSAATQGMETIEWCNLWQRVERSLTDRATQAGMSIEVIEPVAEPTIRFYGNSTAVERILFNLVDNACKYAKSADDRRIHIEVHTSDSKFVSIGVRDHGPGVAAEMRRRLFEPFTKSAQQAARSAPGIGLGLSLSRRLARDMKGDLTLKKTSTPGTTFELKIQLVDP